MLEFLTSLSVPTQGKLLNEKQKVAVQENTLMETKILLTFPSGNVITESLPVV